MNNERLTIDIRSYLFVPQRDDRYHHPLDLIPQIRPTKLR